MRTLLTLLFLLSFMLVFSGCGEKQEEKGSPEYILSIRNWDKERAERLKKENGWLNLVGLYWLDEGENTFGSSKENKIVFPYNAAPQMGAFYLQDLIVTVEIKEDVNVLVDSSDIKTAVLESDGNENTTIMEYKSLRWFMIEREGKFGIRLRDLNAPLVKNFDGIERFPINENWKIQADYVPLNPPLELLIPSVIETVSKDTAYGRLDFEIEGEKYSLYPTGKDELFIVFADETSGVETYGAGRFLTAEAPDSSNTVILDFNKAYNPPCSFTKYATCPIPPKENRINVRITAGEKTYGHGH